MATRRRGMTPRAPGRAKKRLRKPTPSGPGIGHAGPVIPAPWFDMPPCERPYPPGVTLTWNAAVARAAIREYVREAMRPQHETPPFISNAYTAEERAWCTALELECGIELRPGKIGRVPIPQVRCPRCGDRTGRLVLSPDGRWRCWRVGGKCPNVPKLTTLEVVLGELMQAYRYGLSPKHSHCAPKRLRCRMRLAKKAQAAKTADDVLLVLAGGVILSVESTYRRTPLNKAPFRKAPRSRLWQSWAPELGHLLVGDLWHPDAYRGRYGALDTERVARYKRASRLRVPISRSR